MKVKSYVPEALELLAKTLLNVKYPINTRSKLFTIRFQLEGLQKALLALPKADRERIEKFWGLTGGTNHSKKMIHCNPKDVAYFDMRNQAILSLRKLLTLDYTIMYDPVVNAQISSIVKKIDKGELEISDVEAVKYLMAFFIYADNGPKMSFEEDEMAIDAELNESFFLDEYQVLNQISEQLNKCRNNSINLELLISFFEMMDLRDMLIIKKSMGIEISEKSLPEEMKFEDIETVRTVLEIRKLKERVFPYGAWNVASALILSENEDKFKLKDFTEELNSIRKDWAKVVEFKTGQKLLKTKSELRTLNVYNIGGLEFTDVYEVMFLYLERNLIEHKL